MIAKNHFKNLVTFLAIIILLQLPFGALFYNVPSGVEELWIEEYNSISSYLRIVFLCIYFSAPVFIAIAAIAMRYFKNWGRLLFIISITAQILGACLVSWAYRTAFASLWGNILLIIEGIIIAYAYSGEIAKEFSRER